MATETSDVAFQELPGLRIRPLSFIDGACEDDTLLRHHILAPVKAALLPQIAWRDVGRDDVLGQDTVRVSMYPGVPGDVLLMFDLADRNHFRQFTTDGQPFVQGFRKIFVPGNWLRRHLLADRALHLNEDQVVSAGAPRVDYLRDLMGQMAPKSADAPLNVLFAPLHGNWADRHGEPMSMRSAMAPYLDALRARIALVEVEDGRNKDFKRPITRELLDADIVITDYTSVIYEAWALGKPVIFLRWLTGDRIMEKAPHCAEAHIYRERIGHHVESFSDLLALLAEGRDLGLGQGVEPFMADYLDNWSGAMAAPKMARLLERQADPDLEQRDRKARRDLDAAAKAKDWGAAETLLSDLLLWNPDEAGLYDLFARSMNAQGKWWQELDALEQAVALSGNNAALLVRLGDARARMGRPRAAAEAYAEAIRLAPKKAGADLHYKLGFACEAPGHDGPADLRGAAEAYKAACAHTPTGPAARFGVGALHAAAGRWKEAQAAYQARLAGDPLNAELHQRLGMAHDRCYEWPEAEAAYLKALALDPSQAGWHYRLGFVRERQEKHDLAAVSYLRAADLSKTHQGDWFYRAGHVLEKAGRLEEAAAAFLKVQPKSEPPALADPYHAMLLAERAGLLQAELARSPNADAIWASYSEVLEAQGDFPGAAKAITEAVLRAPALNDAYIKRQATLEAKLRAPRVIEARLAHDCTRPQDWLRYATVLEALGRIDEAIDAQQQAVLRSNDHMPDWHHHLGQLLMRAGRLAEACAAFRDQKILQRAHGVDESKFKSQPAVSETAGYREFFDVLPLMPQTALYESFGGEGCSDNPLAIFNQVQADPRFAGWKHFWVVDDILKAPPELRNRRDVFFVLKETLLYRRLLCCVSYLVNNATFPFYYVRKEGQEYLNTWHGTPLKTLGYDIEATPMQRANTARNLIQATMFIAPNAHTEHVMLDRYGVRNLFTGRSLLTGYPRIDMLVNAKDAEKDRIRQRLGLDPSKPVVLFAPTYRGHWATPELEAEALAETLERMKSQDYNLVFRGHYFAEKFILEMNLPVTIAPHAIDTCSLLSVVDVLVTDYSSIFYDFLITRRPVIHFVPDWDYYAETRGVYFGKDQVPGLVCETEDALLAALDACVRAPEAQISQQYLDDMKRYCALEDGKASERVVEALFFNPTAPIKPKLPTGARHILVHGGDLADGAQHAALRGFLAQTKALGHVNTLVVDRRVVINDEMRMGNARAILDRADVLIRFGKACFSLEETWVNVKLTTPGYRATPAMQAVFDASLEHEVCRLFGHAHFDVVIDLDAQRQFWGNVLSAVPASMHMIRLPADIIGETRRAAPGLERVVHLLPRFGHLLSETDQLLSVNRLALAELGVTPGKFAVLPVCVSDAEIEARRVAPIDDPAILAFVSQPGPCLLGMPGNDPVAARHMVEALGEMRNVGHEAVLVLMCSSGAQVAFNRLVAAHRLTEWVRLAPDMQDILPLVAKADVVVVSQAMQFGAHVAAEARQIGKPVVTLQPGSSTRETSDALIAAMTENHMPVPAVAPASNLASLLGGVA